MIYAKLCDAPAYRGIHPNLDLALDHLIPEFLATVGETRQDLDSDRVYATRFSYETVPLEESFFEAHKRYLDIHLLLKGQERVDIAHPDDLDLFRQEGDFYAYRGEGAQSLLLKPGEFLVVFPGDAHRIKIQVNGPEVVTKAVFKILVNE